jgi:hypothetical protein
LSIIQPDQRKDAVAGQYIEAPEAYPSPAADPQPRQLPESRLDFMPVFLWSGLLAIGVLMLLARGPSNAPAFEQLTQYLCDPVTPLPNRGYRMASYTPRFTCRAGDKIVFQNGYPSDGSNPDVDRDCRRSGGIVRVWRDANPSPYGPYVFHSTCNDRVLMSYIYRAGNYDSAQRSVLGVASLLIFLGGIGLTRKLLARRTHRASRT